MRTAFIKTITELAEKDSRVCLLTGDLGYSVFEDFRDRFPNQYLNVGVAEQNMMGIAAGMAMLGKLPYVYSISTFATMRAYEQIRNDICYQNLPVVIIGGGSTFSYSTFGCTHMPIEDFAIMRVLPNMRVLAPGDPLEVSALLKETYKKPGPTYIRIAKKGEPIINTSEENIILGKVTEIRNLKDNTEYATIISAGRILPDVIAAADILKTEGINVKIISSHTLKPFDEIKVLEIIKNSKIVITCDEHSIVGALGSIVSEIIAKNGISIPFAALGVPDEFPKGVGSQAWFLKKYGLDPESIALEVKKQLEVYATRNK